MDVCLVSQDGEVVLHRNMPAAPNPLLKAMAPYRDGLVVAVECICPWYWLAERCAPEGIPFVRGHAVYRQAIHGGKAKNEQIDAQKIAVLFRGGMLPQAYVYPAAMRATRALLRRRLSLPRTRAALLGQVQQTTSPYTLPQIGKKRASKTNRTGVVERFSAPAVQKSMEVDVALIGFDDELRRAREWHIVKAANQHAPQTLSLRQTVPGIGKILRLVLGYECHDSARFPSVQGFVSYCRLVQGAKESASKRDGTSGTHIGKASLKWACSEAAVLSLRDHPAGQQYLASLAQKHGKGTALTILAHTLARAV
jgi:transposase